LDFIQDIQLFGLNFEEAKVYLMLLEKGEVGDVVGRLKERFLEVNRTTLYGILERLIEKNWIMGIKITKKPKRIKYVANPPFEVLNRIIDKQENYLNALKQKVLHIGDILEKIYKGPRSLTLETIHPDSRRFLKRLFENKWKVLSEVIEHSESLERIVFDYELEGPKGFQKKCGLIIFEYSRNIEKDKNLVQSAMNLLKSKTEYEIRNHEIPDFEDVKLNDMTIGDYIGSFVFLKFKTGTPTTKFLGDDWVLAAKQVAIPLNNKIVLIWGEEENFQFLMETFLKAS